MVEIVGNSPTVRSTCPNPKRQRAIESFAKSLADVSGWDFKARKHLEVNVGPFLYGEGKEVTLRPSFDADCGLHVA